MAGRYSFEYVDIKFSVEGGAYRKKAKKMRIHGGTQ
jgi:hypothetical protein